MLGWLVCVYRQSNPTLPAPNTAPTGEQLAVWQTHLYGLDWLDNLVQQGKVRQVAVNGGYPIRYTGLARDLLPFIANPPNARERWLFDEGDILLPTWKGQTEINKAEIDRCSPEEWLLIEKWDES